MSESDPTLLLPHPSPLDYSAHPHIIEEIIGLSLPTLTFRGVSRSTKRHVDRLLGAHLLISQDEGRRWLDFRSCLPCSSIRLPGALGRQVAIQIVDPALLLQRSFRGMVFRVPRHDTAWLSSTLAAASTISILGDIWYGNRTLPHYCALVSVPSVLVPQLRLLPAIERGAAAAHYPSLHPFMAPRVEMSVQMPTSSYERAWVGMTTLLPPQCEVVHINVCMDGGQPWEVDRDGQLVYPETVRDVSVNLEVQGVMPSGSFRILAFKLFRDWRDGVAWTVGLNGLRVEQDGDVVEGDVVHALLLGLVGVRPRLMGVAEWVEMVRPSFSFI